MSLNLRCMRTKPKTPTLRTPSSNPIARRTSKLQVNAVSDANVDKSSYATRLNKKVSSSYAKRLNANLIDMNKNKSSCAQKIGPQLHREKLRKKKMRMLK